MKRNTPRCALFDLDGTVYPYHSGVMHLVGQRIQEYMSSRLHMDEPTITDLRHRYWEQYGTSMRGLMLDYAIDPDDYLSYVHDVSVSETLAPNARLGRVLTELPWRKVIFTNASAEHAVRVLEVLGVRDHFERIYDIRATGYIGKPDPAAFHPVLDSLGVAAADCIVLDDSLANLRTARLLGMVTVWVGADGQSDDVDFSIGCIDGVGEVARQLTAEENRGSGFHEVPARREC